MDEAIDHIYASLIQRPHHEWKDMIQHFDPQVKRGLFMKLRQKRLKSTTLETEKKMNLEGGSSFSGFPLSESLQKADIKKESVCEETILPKTVELGICEDGAEQNTENLCMANGNEMLTIVQENKNLGNSTQRKKRATVKQVDLTSCSRSVVLEGIKDLMYVSGDAYEVIPESESLVQYYLSCWFSLALEHYQSIHEKKKQSQITKDLVKRGTTTTVNLIGCFETSFPREFSHYQSKMELHHKARSSLVKSLALPPEPASLDPPNLVGLDPKVFCEADIEKLSPIDTEKRLASHLESTESYEEGDSSTHKEFRDHIMGVERFAERVKVQDLRTKHMNTVEYRRFTKARESFSRHSTKSFTSWFDFVFAAVDKSQTSASHFQCTLKGPPKKPQAATQCSALGQSTPPESGSHKFTLQRSTSRRAVPRRPAMPLTLLGSSTKFLLFLVSDRLSSIVELALRLRAFLCHSEIFSSESKNSALALLDPMSFYSTYTQGNRLPSFFDVFSNECTNNSPKDSKNRIKSGTPIDPIYYKCSILFYLEFIDRHQFQADVSNIQQRISRTHFSTSPEQLKGASSTDENTPETVSHSKSLDPPLVSNQDSRETPCDVDTFFGCVLREAMEGAGECLLPEELVVYGYLRCRDLFWTHRHEVSGVVWKEIYQRYRLEKDSESESYKTFYSSYVKMIKYLIAFHEVLSFQHYFKSLLNVSNTKSLMCDIEEKHFRFPKPEDSAQ